MNRQGGFPRRRHQDPDRQATVVDPTRRSNSPSANNSTKFRTVDELAKEITLISPAVVAPQADPSRPPDEWSGRPAPSTGSLSATAGAGVPGRPGARGIKT